jgi:hypothetical protein
MKGFKAHGFIGMGILAVAMGAILIDNIATHDLPLIHKLNQWTTPLCWWGYILLLDAILYRREGWSYISTYRRRFRVMLPLSILFWLVFELYNLHLKNWRYIGLPSSRFETICAMGISFATIMPGIFLTAEMLHSLKLFRRLKTIPLHVTPKIIYWSILCGWLLLLFPLLLQYETAKYTFGMVWLGFLFLLDPIVYANGGNALLADLEKGYLGRIGQLFIAGLICGFLWEFWNYWSATKWIYLAPFTQEIKLFEMPLLGYLGFPPFAWEYFAMYQFIRLFDGKDSR